MPHRFPWWRLSLLSIGGSLLFGVGLPVVLEEVLGDRTGSTVQQNCQAASSTDFLVAGGGGAPSYNEIALEKNVLYFQRTLQAMGFNPSAAEVYFANGTNGQATIRYMDEQGQIQFKVPDIPNLTGASTFNNLRSWVAERAEAGSTRPIFFYFTGHGLRNEQDLNNNAIALWGNQQVSVQQLAQVFDTLPPETPVVAMMAQCYSGSFANLMYEGGKPFNRVASQNRCGFFATIRTLPSVGCTPEVNEADYEDYSSSFFAGLSGISRTGERVSSADYNRDGHVVYAEAHAFAKVDEETTDLPISTSEVWLQEQAAIATQDAILNQPMQATLETARPEQRYVVEALAQSFGFDLNRSFIENQTDLQSRVAMGEVPLTYLERIRMELINIGMEAQVRTSGDEEAIAILDRLLNCENGYWQ
ncbi:Caspase domain-containing protein [Leptolyngbya sp. FACHB-16]|nr:Caspase domain-containing protein [Leptolyngbya sp. FACHB-16]MBD1912786.1 Caspase domain-containing protein [Leptolyngbya sp. FACHB-8]MBD2157733.1 Caspase domain-containing protein [Leptolyngbya sp. FACHB-16]